jgi:hypothetical protein
MRARGDIDGQLISLRVVRAAAELQADPPFGNVTLRRFICDDPAAFVP